MFQAQWRRLDQPGAAAVAAPTAARVPCARRFHVSGVIYVPDDGSSGGCGSVLKKLLVVFGGKTTALPSSDTRASGSNICAFPPPAESSVAVAEQRRTSSAAVERYLGGGGVPYVFDPCAQQWLGVEVHEDPLFGVPAPRAYHAAAVQGHRLIICGGKTTTTTRNTGMVPTDASYEETSPTGTVLSDVWVCSFECKTTCECADDNTDGDAPLVVARWSRRDLLSPHSGSPMSYHTCALLSPSTLVISGGNNGVVWDDTVRTFDLNTNAWTSRSVATPLPTPSAGGAVHSSTTSCGCTWPQHQFCVHSSKTLRPVLFRRLLASQQLKDIKGGAPATPPSLPPREGHSMVVTVPRRRASASYIDECQPPHNDALRDGVLIFGGEVAMTTFNTLIRIDVGITASTVPAVNLNHNWLACAATSCWTVLSGGPEYSSHTDASPARQHACFGSAAPSYDQERVQLSPSPHRGDQSHGNVVDEYDGGTAPATASPHTKGRVITISESPPRHWEGMGSQFGHLSTRRDANLVDDTLLNQQRGPLPEHRAFHTAWPSGTSGMLVYGGVARRGQCVLRALRRYDTIARAWVDVVDLEGADGAPHPGPRASCPFASQPSPLEDVDMHMDTTLEGTASGKASCSYCGAPKDPCYLIGGETQQPTTGNAPTTTTTTTLMDVWELTVHYAGCTRPQHVAVSPPRCFTGLNLGAVTPALPLTPPPRRRQHHGHDPHPDGRPRAVPLALTSDTTAGEATGSHQQPRVSDMCSQQQHTSSMKVSLLPLKLLLALYINEHMPNELSAQRMAKKVRVQQQSSSSSKPA